MAWRVADFYSLHAFGFYWYVFNIADVAIVAGVVALLYDSFIASRNDAAKTLVAPYKPGNLKNRLSGEQRMPRTSMNRLARLAIAAAAAVAVGGCSLDDVELNGGVFDALGVGANQPKASEPKLAARTAPGGAALDCQFASTWRSRRSRRRGRDHRPERTLTEKSNVDRATLEKQHDEYCRINYDPARAAGDASADSVEGPLGPCRPSVLTAVKKWNGGERPARCRRRVIPPAAATRIF